MFMALGVGAQTHPLAVTSTSTTTTPLPFYILCNPSFCLEPNRGLNIYTASSVYLSGFSEFYGSNVFTADFIRVKVF